jgi:uncharacterized protein YbjT (DUF2867 family)
MSTHLPHSSSDTTLVIGATGKTGSRVAQRLQQRGVPTRLGSRSGDTPFHRDDRSTWEPVVAGAHAVYVSYFPDLAVPGAAETVGDLARVAVAGGVRRIVLLSGRGEPEAQRAERLVAEAGADWTVVRCSWFDQNFSEGYLLDPILAGEVVLPVDGVPEPFVDVDGVADVAVAALTSDGHAGEVYEVLDGRNVEVCDGVRRALGREPRDFTGYARRAAATGVWGAAR